MSSDLCFSPPTSVRLPSNYNTQHTSDSQPQSSPVLPPGVSVGVQAVVDRCAACVECPVISASHHRRLSDYLQTTTHNKYQTLNPSPVLPPGESVGVQAVVDRCAACVECPVISASHHRRLSDYLQTTTHTTHQTPNPSPVLPPGVSVCAVCPMTAALAAQHT